MFANIENIFNALTKFYRAIMKTWRAAGYKQVYVLPKYYSSSIVRQEDYNLILIATMDDDRLTRAQTESRAVERCQTGLVRLNNYTFHASHYLPD